MSQRHLAQASGPFTAVVTTVDGVAHRFVGSPDVNTDRKGGITVVRDLHIVAFFAPGGWIACYADPEPWLAGPKGPPGPDESPGMAAFRAQQAERDANPLLSAPSGGHFVDQTGMASPFASETTPNTDPGA